MHQFISRSLLHSQLLIFIAIFSLSACTQDEPLYDDSEQAVAESSAQTDNSSMAETNVESSDTMSPAKVKIEKINDVYRMTVNGQPFHIKGAGLDYRAGKDFAGLKAAGANAFRTWGTETLDIELAQAKEHGLMMAVGLDVDKELHGFDYNDEEAVAKQFEKVKATVQKYKNHPNVLAWVVANEPNLLVLDNGTLGIVNPKVYEAISEIIDYIHAEDPNHPVTYTFAGVIPDHIKTAMQYTPQVDFVSVQVYGDLRAVNDMYANLDIDKPFTVTEYGPLGHWETPFTAWGREIEEPSSVKAAGMAERIQKGLAVNPTGKNIGGFAFLWGQKQERTPTWYGMYHKDGSQTERIDEMTKYWTGKYPENRAPQVKAIRIDNQLPVENIYLAPNANAVATLDLVETDGDDLECKWTMLSEVVERSDGGAFEKEPGNVDFAINAEASDCAKGVLSFVTPEKEGDYRLFAYVYDGKGKVGYANAPFFIKP